jgi:hypothetical protein
VAVDFAVNEPLNWFFGLARLTPDGHFDPSFAGGGFFSAPFWADPPIPPPRHSAFNVPAALAFDDSARSVLGGTVSDPIPQDAVAYRVQPDGAFDDTFGQAGHSLLGIDVGAAWSHSIGPTGVTSMPAAWRCKRMESSSSPAASRFRTRAGRRISP